MQVEWHGGDRHRAIGRNFKLGWHQNLMSFVPFFPEKLGWHHYTFYSISIKSWGGTCHPGHPSNYGPAIFGSEEYIEAISIDFFIVYVKLSDALCTASQVLSL